MSTPRPIHATLATVIVTAGFLAPWALGRIQAPEQATVVLSEPPPREARFVVVPEQLLEADEVESDEALSVEPPAEEVAEVVEEPPAETAPPPELELVEGAPGLQLASLEAPIDAPPRSLTTRHRVRPKRSTTTTRPKRESRACLPEREDIYEVGDLSHRVEDELVYHYANHMKEAQKLAATWWNHDEDGERFGFKVGRMRCGSILHQAGFRNGDVITHVNGLEIRSYADGVTAYMQLRAKRVLWVDVLRRGEPVRLDFVLVQPGVASAELSPEDPLYDPTALVDRELELDELPWLKRRMGKRKDRREQRRWARAREFSLQDEPSVAEGQAAGEEQPLDLDAPGKRGRR